MEKRPPVDVVGLLPVLDDLLLDLLQSLRDEEWQLPTVAKQWLVKDVVAHLLDGNIRILSMLRDGYYGEKPDGTSFGELVSYLNGLNADWVKAMRRVSPAMLVLLHKATGKLYCDYYSSLDPFGPSPFPVNWAGESESRNWMHIAREYTEKWLHQQQIREAVNKPGLMTEALFLPMMNIFMLALPFAYREVVAEPGTGVRIHVTGKVSGSWTLSFTAGSWMFGESADGIACEIFIPADLSWKLFSKSLRYEQVRDQVRIEGDLKLGKPALEMVSVMA